MNITIRQERQGDLPVTILNVSSWIKIQIINIKT